VSKLLNGRISKFSVSKRIKFAGKLNLGAQVRLTQPTKGKLRTIEASAKIRKQAAASV
jgi:hypothetical protein